MVDFNLTEEQEDMREMAHDFAEKEIRPVAWDYDRDATWPQQIIEKAWQVGLMNSQLPERYGGAGASYLDGVLIGEELAWGCAAIATTLGISSRRRRCCSPARSRSRPRTSACSPRSRSWPPSA
jgi:acyl-CoA dehydrogenase